MQKLGVVLVLIGLGCIGWITESQKAFVGESQPFTISLADLEKNGPGDHKYLKITDAIAPGNACFNYGTHAAGLVKGDVKYMVYPVISTDQFKQYVSSLIDSDAVPGSVGNIKSVTAKVVVRFDTTFDAADIDSFKMSKGPLTIEGVVTTGSDHSLTEDERKIIEDNDLKLSESVIYLDKGKPDSIIFTGFKCVLSASFILLGIYTYTRKKIVPTTPPATPK